MSNTEFEHYGVMGMKWGVRKAVNSNRERRVKKLSSSARKYDRLADRASKDSKVGSPSATADYRKEAAAARKKAESIRTAPQRKAAKLRKSADVNESKAIKLRKTKTPILKQLHRADARDFEKRADRARKKADNVLANSVNRPMSAAEKKQFKQRFAATTAVGAIAFSVATMAAQGALRPTVDVFGKRLANFVTGAGKSRSGDIFKYATKNLGNL